MATYHCCIKTGSKGKGASGTAKADYICREGKYADKPDLEYKESGNMPSWAQDNPRIFWQATDENERANGRVYTEIEIALPRDYSTEDHKAMVQGFIKEQLKNHPYTVAIHNPKASLDGGEQPHAHIIFSERKLDGIERGKEQFFKRAAAPYRDRKTKKMVTPDPATGGAIKDRAWNDRDKVQTVREAWEKQHNKSVFSDDQISCKSLKAQGIDRHPERHLGPKMARSLMADKIIEIRSDRKELEEISREMLDLSKEIEKAETLAAAKSGTIPQDVVVQPKPQKTDILSAAESKNEENQEISQTPDTTRRGDPDQLQEKPVNTTSSELSEALPLGNKPSIQQPVVEPEIQSVPSETIVVDSPAPALTAEDLRRIAGINREIARLNRMDISKIEYDRFYDRHTSEIKAIWNNAPGIRITIEDRPCPVEVNGQPITEMVKALPPEPKPSLAQTPGITRTGGRK